MKTHPTIVAILVLVAALLVLTASCAGPGVPPTPTATPTAEPPTPTQTMTPTPTPFPPTFTPAPTTPPAPPTATPAAKPTPVGTPGLRERLGGYVGDIRGTLQEDWFHSTILGRDMPYLVYLPPGYNLSERRYPVLYMLHPPP